MTNNKRQLRGNKLKTHLRTVIEADVADSSAKRIPYKYGAKRVADAAGCSRTTLLKHAAFVEQVLADLNGGPRSSYGASRIRDLQTRIEKLEERLATRDAEVAGLRAERFELYDRLLRGGVDISLLYRTTGELTSHTEEECMRYDSTIDRSPNNIVNIASVQRPAEND